MTQILSVLCVLLLLAIGCPFLLSVGVIVGFLLSVFYFYNEYLKGVSNE